jgi:hypothetical protein
MALHDLTPQLRTRLNRMERVVGWFVIIATLLLVVGLAYYIYQVAQRKGWFLKKVPYFTFVRNATGLAVGDRVKLMGFDVGQITEITAMPPQDIYFNVYIQFEVKEPYYGYLWDDSRAKVGGADFLGNRFIEVTKGSNGPPTYAAEVREVSPADLLKYGGTNNYVFAETVQAGTNVVVKHSDFITPENVQRLIAVNSAPVQIIDKSAPGRPRWILDDKAGRYVPIPRPNKGYWLHVDESPALTERLEKVVDTVEAALPNFLGLTNTLVRMTC